MDGYEREGKGERTREMKKERGRRKMERLHNEKRLNYLCFAML
jgi:hypothetical protein